MITETQKLIYNLYLKSSRVNQNKPYRYKRNFDKFETSEHYPDVVKLETFFKKYPHLLKDDFFNAPYKMYADEKQYYGLKFYSSFKGFTTCLAYYKNMVNSKPDSQIDFIKESLKFITEFCLEKKILLSEYTHYKTVSQNDFLKHLKEHRISWYVITGIPSLFDFVYKLEPDEFELYFGSDIDLNALYNNFNSSTQAKNILEKGSKKIETFLKKKLNRG